jgi:prophage maintenance system killer protein
MKQMHRVGEAMGMQEMGLVNDILYENYASSTRYNDDFFDKTAMFLDQLSLTETHQTHAYTN